MVLSRSPPMRSLPLRGYVGDESRGQCEGSASSRVDLFCNISRVSADSWKHHRAERVLERQPAEEQPRSGGHNATHLLRPTVAFEDRQLDPVEHLTETGAPDDIGDVQHPTAIEHRSPIANAGYPLQDPLNTALGEVGTFYPQHWSAVEPDVLHRLAPDRCPSGDQVSAEEQKDWPEQPSAPMIKPHRHLSRVTAGEDCPMAGCHPEGNIGTRVRPADNQHRTRLELRRPAVLAGMQLSDCRIKIKGEIRNAWGATEGPRRHYDVLGCDPAASKMEHIVPIRGLQAIYAGPRPHREREPLGVRREVVSDLLFGRISPFRRRKGQAW